MDIDAHESILRRCADSVNHSLGETGTIPRVAIYVVSDLHGADDALVKAVPEGAILLLLGDLINFIDYTSMSGILTEVFSVETVSEVVRLRTAGDVLEARRVMEARSEGREQEVRAEIGSRVQTAYDRLFEALPEPTYLLLGNVDNPKIAHWLCEATPAVTWADGRVFELDGERFAFVGGALPTPLHVAGEISVGAMTTKVESLGEADVLCSHIPPAVPELCYDTRAKRVERGSEALLAYIEEVQPRRHYFGHVHQPLLSSMHIGRTLCLNVGYFRRTRRAFAHRSGDD